MPIAAEFNGHAEFLDQDQNKIVRLGISTNASGNRYLIFEVQGRHAGILFPMYRVPVVLLEATEHYLDAGRFAKFDLNLDENRCDLRVHHQGLVGTGGIGPYKTLNEFMEAALIWCQEHAELADSRWGFALNISHLQDMTMSFFFESTDLAVLFKLYWS